MDQRVSDSPLQSQLLAQAAVIAVRLRFGPEVLPGYSREIPLSDILVI